MSKSVTEKLGLSRLTHKTAENCLERANQIEKMLEKNQVHRSIVKSAQTMVGFYRREAKKLAGKKAKPNGKPTFPQAAELTINPASIKKVLADIDKRNGKGKAFDSKQGILPGFTGMLNTARIEELVAEMVFKALQRGLDRREKEERAVEVTPIFKAV